MNKINLQKITPGFWGFGEGIFGAVAQGRAGTMRSKKAKLQGASHAASC